MKSRKRLHHSRTPSASTGQCQAINIVTVGDQYYLQHITVMLCSFFAKNQHHNVNAFVIVPENTQKCLLTKIKNSMTASFSSKLHFLFHADISAKVFGMITTATYFKLVIGEILPPDIDRVLYLDGDIIVRGDIKDLYNYPIDIVGAVPDTVNQETFKKLGLLSGEPYFNAGVLLVDLDKWRADRIGARALEFARSHPDRISFAEQCALNWVLRGRWTPLPERWNLQAHTLAPKSASRRVKAAQIIHFSGNDKPWYYMTRHPAKREYLSYLSRTEWKSYKYPDYSIRNVILKYATPGVRTQLSRIKQKLVRKGLNIIHNGR
jgi:lipopolysaccharide biosynthesis glycosyltransferase